MASIYLKLLQSFLKITQNLFHRNIGKKYFWGQNSNLFYLLGKLSFSKI